MENFNRIQRYLTNEMSASERQQFEESVRQNDELAMELEVQRFQMETIDQIEEDDLREKLLRLSALDENKQHDNVRQLEPAKRNMRWIYGIAASLVLLAGFFFLQSSENQYAQLTADAYNQARIDFTRGSISRGDETESIFPTRYTDILRTRNADQAQDAIVYFFDFSSDDKLVESQAMLNLGHAYLLQEEFPKAAAIFSEVRARLEATRARQEEATFFEAMALLQSGKKSAAMQLLTLLAKEGQRYDAIAKATINELDA